MGLGWLADVSWDVFADILANGVGMTAARPPTHRRQRKMMLVVLLLLRLVHRWRSMYLVVEAQRRKAAWTGKNRYGVHFE